MADMGNLAIILTLILGIYSFSGSAMGIRGHNSAVIQSAKNAAYIIPIGLSLATICLVYCFVTNDFSVKYVAEHSSRAMDAQYVWVAFYAGNEGSLLFIALALSVLSAIAIYTSPKTMDPSLPHTNLVLMAISIFFVGVMVLLANPFEKLTFTPADGQGINPLLTHPGMFIHPPMLMTGLISFSIPFSFAMGALISGKTGDEWVEVGRVWGILGWATLGSGLLLGAWWAYTILGWGGYWGWDPVENSGLMPWLVMTAFIHSIMVQKRFGMFRMWNIALIILTFGYAQLGMFINRGGPVPSVHSFGQSTLGWVFLIFMAFTLIISFGIFFLRYDKLKSARKLESALSREASFLVNNLLFLTVAFITMWGVLYPLISELTQGQTITVGQPFYNQVNGPVFLLLITLMGIAPFLPWRHASWNNLRNAMAIPAATAILVSIILVVFGITEPFAVLSFSICTLVTVGIISEWIRGTHSRHKRGEPYHTAFFKLIASNRPRYGGYIVHLAVVLLALGVTGSSFYDLQKDISLHPGESTTLGGYTIQYIDSHVTDKIESIESNAEIHVFRGDSLLGIYYTGRDFYPAHNMASTRATIRTTPVEDLYIILGDFLDDGRAVFRILVNPLVVWIWVAGPMLILGALIALWPANNPSTRSMDTEAEIV